MLLSQKCILEPSFIGERLVLNGGGKPGSYAIAVSMGDPDNLVVDFQGAQYAMVTTAKVIVTQGASKRWFEMDIGPGSVANVTGELVQVYAKKRATVTHTNNIQVQASVIPSQCGIPNGPQLTKRLVASRLYGAGEPFSTVTIPPFAIAYKVLWNENDFPADEAIWVGQVLLDVDEAPFYFYSNWRMMGTEHHREFGEWWPISPGMIAIAAAPVVTSGKTFRVVFLLAP